MKALNSNNIVIRVRSLTIGSSNSLTIMVKSMTVLRLLSITRYNSRGRVLVKSRFHHLEAILVVLRVLIIRTTRR